MKVKEKQDGNIEMQFRKTSNTKKVYFI